MEWRFMIDEVNDISYERGDLVAYAGNGSLKPLKETYVWARLQHLTLDLYLIEHPDGGVTKEVLKHNGGFDDGFESIHSSKVRKGLRYTYVHKELLTLIKRNNEAENTINNL